MVLLGMEALAAAERKPGRGAGIVTLRRQPPRMHVARQPRARPPPRMAPPPPSWQDVQNRNHAFYQLGMKAKIDAAQAVAVGEPGGDALDALVEIQRDRQKRLQNIHRQQNKPIVQRLVHPAPPPPPPMDPLQLFMEHVKQQQAAMGAVPSAATKVYHARPKPALQNQPNMPTKMGLFYAR